MAGSFLGSLLVEIKGDNSKLDKSIKGSEGSVKKFAKYAKLGYAAIGVAIIALGKKAQKAASDAEEIASKYKTVFRDIPKQAENAMRDLADSYGLADSTAQELLGNTGDLVTGLGLQQEAALEVSLQTNQLALDLASFTNAQGGAAAVSAALTSAYTGEREALKTYGIIISEADVKAKLLEQRQEGLTFESERQAKIFATLALATQQSGNAIGDYARTSESAANVQRRLEESGKSLSESIGVALLPAVTSIKSLLGDWAKAISEVVSKNNELRDANKAASEGNATREQTILLLQKEINAIKSKRDLVNENAAKSAEEIEITNKLAADKIRLLEMQITTQLRLGNVESDIAQAKKDKDQVALDLAEREKQSIIDNTKALDELTKRNFEALSTNKQRLILIQQEIDLFATQRKQAQDLGEEWQNIQNLINDLYRERNELQLEELEIINETATAQDFMFDNGLSALHEQSSAVQQLQIDYETLTTDGLGAFASTFKMMGEEGVTVWDTLKQAGKNAVSAVLEGLAQEALVRASLNVGKGIAALSNPFTAALAPGFFKSAGAFTAAAAGAFAASGLVQNLAEGGVLQPSSGGTPAIMAEAGVPEMAMPLTSSAINPFADAVASRISTTTNNNTQNFNSTFSLNDDNQLREAARRLFPFMRDEDIRRGITV